MIPNRSLCDWWSGHSSILPLIDIRSTQEHCYRRIETRLLQCNIIGEASTSSLEEYYQNIPIVVHIPWDALLTGQRSCELPPRYVEFGILVSANSSSSSSSSSSPSDKDIVMFFSASRSSATFQSRQPWKLSFIVRSQEEDWLLAQNIGVPILGVNETMSRSSVVTSHYNIPVAPPRLWTPDPMIQCHILPRLKSFVDVYLQGQNWNTHTTFPKQVWDLGCGSGRDVCFLATELKYYFTQRLLLHSPDSSSSQVTFPLRFLGLDRHKKSQELCEPFWERYQVSDIACAIQLDLKKNEWKGMFQDQADLILCIFAVRYLNRKVLNYLTGKGGGHPCPLKSGTIFALSHFCKEEAHESWNFEHPKADSVLERDEMSSSFSKNGAWTIDCDELRLDGDHGRSILSFVATRTAKELENMQLETGH